MKHEQFWIIDVLVIVISFILKVGNIKFVYYHLSLTYKMSAMVNELVNEHDICHIFEGGIFFVQSDWLSAKN